MKRLLLLALTAGLLSPIAAKADLTNDLRKKSSERMERYITHTGGAISAICTAYEQKWMSYENSKNMFDAITWEFERTAEMADPKYKSGLEILKTTYKQYFPSCKKIIDSPRVFTPPQ